MPVPEKLGKYRLVRRLAQGGMAEIFLAKQEGPGGFEKNVVIKRILPEFSDQPQFLKMFLDEARIAAQLSHPNIVQLFDFGEVDGQHFLCMEYLAGEDLSFIFHHCRREGIRFPPAVAASILAAVADALNYAHEFVDDRGQALNIVHRDVTPSNIFLTYQGQVKVLDFGIARAEGRLDKTRAGLIKGKLKYMSPEQILAKSIDSRSDIFALGAVGYALLTGEEAFARTAQTEVFQAVVNDPIVSPRDKNGEVPAELSAIIMKALERDVKARYQTAADLKRDAEDYLANVTYVSHASALAGFLKEVLGAEHIRRRQSVTRDGNSSAPLASSSPLAEATMAPPPESITIAPPEPPTAGAGSAPSALRPTDADVTASDDGTGESTTKGGRPSRKPSSLGKKRVPLQPVKARSAMARAPWYVERWRLLAGVGAAVGVLFTVVALVSSPPAPVSPPASPVAVPKPVPPPGIDPGAAAAPTRPVTPMPAPPPELVPDAPEPVKVSVPSAPAPQPPSQPAPPRPPKAKPGYLSVNCIPWGCRILLDGKDTGKQAPLMEMPLKPGKYRLKVVDSASGKSREVALAVEEGRTEKAIVDFTKP